jgi:hypothetical protein
MSEGPAKKKPGSRWRSTTFEALGYEMPEPSRWEMLLRDLGLTDDEVCLLLSSRDGRADRRAYQVAQWVRQNAWSAFVPENVLLALGITVRECGSDSSGNWKRGSRRRGLGE